MNKPKYIVWLITPNCNLNCRHCYVRERPWKNELSTEEALRLISKLADLGVVALNLTGGEPLLRKDIFDIIDYALDNGISVSIFSNLLLLNDRIARELERRNIYVLTSLDGSRPEVHDYIRGEGTWRKTVEGIKLLKKRDISVHTSFTITKYNYFDIAGYVELAVNLNVDYISCIPVIPSTKKAREAMPNYSQVKEALISFENKARELGVEASVWCAPFARLYLKGYVYVGTCPTLTMIDISPSGQLLLCDTLDIVVGNFIEEDFEELKERYLEYVDKILASVPSKCKTCQVNYICKGGCFARRYLLRKENMPDVLCPLSLDS